MGEEPEGPGFQASRSNPGRTGGIHVGQGDRDATGRFSKLLADRTWIDEQSRLRGVRRDSLLGEVKIKKLVLVLMVAVTLGSASTAFAESWTCEYKGSYKNTKAKTSGDFGSGR